MSIAIIADMKYKTINSATYELFTCAQKIGQQLNMHIHYIIPCNDAVDIHSVPNSTTWCIDVSVEKYSPLAVAHTISHICSLIHAQFIIGLHSPFTIDFLPAVAYKYGAQCITSIHSVKINNKSITISRSSCNGKLEEHVHINDIPIVISILPGSYAQECNIVSIQKSDINVIPLYARSHCECEYICTPDSSVSLHDADVVVGIGKGVGSKENVELFYQFARLFAKGAVAGSKIVCDYGWIPYSMQVGITGNHLASKVYIACGISGSSQHVAAIQQVKTIIAINKDPHAPIFNVSHYGIVDDMFHVIPHFIEFVSNFGKT